MYPNLFLHACSPQEIQTSLRISLKTSPLEYDEIEDLLSQETIEEEVQNSTDSITSSTYGDFGDPVSIAQSCPPESANSYCRNGGTCFAQYDPKESIILFCNCAPGWAGHQCQHTYNPKLYESAKAKPEVENVNVGSLITVILVAFIIFSGLIYFSKTFCKAHDLREYMYSESSIDPTTMTPVQMYPFSQRSSPSTSDHLTPILSYTVCRQQQILQEAEKEYQQELSQITLKSYNHFPYP
uniref:EGF-like domain-containing protein n=1 Tax=Panagrolaimus sp. PS1159 TaxID=55785 RepID=A0AC35GKK2_9BILA